jgi:GNAT superfamily N-acetyltransferase
MVVTERLRGRGIGRALVERVEAEAQGAGCDRLELTTSEQRGDAHAFIDGWVSPGSRGASSSA